MIAAEMTIMAADAMAVDVAAVISIADVTTAETEDVIAGMVAETDVMTAEAAIGIDAMTDAVDVILTAVTTGVAVITVMIAGAVTEIDVAVTEIGASLMMTIVTTDAEDLEVDPALVRDRSLPLVKTTLLPMATTSETPVLMMPITMGKGLMEPGRHFNVIERNKLMERMILNELSTLYLYLKCTLAKTPNPPYLWTNASRKY